MNITKDFYICPLTKNHVYEHHTVINGESVSARFTVSGSRADLGGTPPLDHITSHLRSQLEQEVGKLLYKGVR